jgi:hypothetical protein
MAKETKNEQWSIEDAKTVREMIRHEGELVNHRLSWMVTLQGLLFAALGFAWKDGRELIYILCSLGIAISLSTLLSLKLGQTAVHTLRNEWDSHKPSDYHGPDVIGVRTSSKYVRYLRPWYFVPVLFVFGWIAVVIINLFRP